MYTEKIFGLFTLYGLSIAIGVLCAVLVLFIFAKGRIKDSFIDFLFYNGVVAIALGFGAATLFQSFYNYLDSGVWKWGGMTFMGGLIGGVVTFLAGYFIFRKRLEGRLVDIISLLPCCIVIAHAFGRIGCLMAGCCHGKYLGPSYVVGGVYMDPHGAVAGYYVPTQLYEALFLFALFAILSVLYFKKCNIIMALYLNAYGLWRFFVEFLRTDARGGFLLGLSPSQWQSFVFIIIALILLCVYRAKKIPFSLKNKK